MSRFIFGFPKTKSKLKRTEYKKIKIPKNHFHTRTKTIQEHRLIFEKYYKCCLLPKANIHHIDGNSLNNDPQNLMAFINISKHKIYENGADKRICVRCKSNKTYVQKINKFPQWYNYPEGFVCCKCWISDGQPKIKDRGFVDIKLRKAKNSDNITYSEMEITVNSHFKNNKVFTIKH